MNPYIRWMIRPDMPEVYEIERLSNPHPWSEDNFLQCLRQRNVIGFVVERGGVVDGFMVYELHEERLHVLNLAVHPRCRRTGVGTVLVRKLVNQLSVHRRTSITLVVEEDNTAALLFFKRRGFRAVGMADGAVRMEYRIACDVDELIDQLTSGAT